jgi:hypothetical protein
VARIHRSAIRRPSPLNEVGENNALAGFSFSKINAITEKRSNKFKPFDRHEIICN